MHMPFRRPMGLFAVVAPLVFFLASPRHAGAQAGPSQQGQSDMIPRELALALLNFGPGMSGGDIRVGKAADDTPVELIPPGAQVLGSMVQFESSIIVLGVAQPPDSAIALMESRLLAMGWTKPPVPRGRSRGGFVGPDLTAGVYVAPDIVCRGEEFVMLSGTYRRSGGSILKVSYNRNSRNSMCRAQQDIYRPPYEDAPIPTLRAPAGSMTIGGSSMGSSGNDQVTLSTRLSTRLEPDSVVAHYDVQMRAAGWTTLSEGSVAFVSAHVYRTKDDKGRNWMATLVAIGQPDAPEMDVMLRLLRR